MALFCGVGMAREIFSLRFLRGGVMNDNILPFAEGPFSRTVRRAGGRGAAHLAKGGGDFNETGRRDYH